MKRFVWVGSMLVVAVGLMLWSTKPDKVARAPANSEQAQPEVEAAPQPAVVLDAGVVAKPASPERELLPLDCDAPSGDIVTIDRDAIRAADFCARFRQLAGPSAAGDPSVMERQGRALLERMIDAFLVDRALSQAGQRVSEREVDEELERAWRPLDPEHRARTRAELATQLKEQGIGIQTVREDLRQRAGLRKLVELRGALEPSEAEIAAAYNEDPTRFGTPRSATVEGFIARAAPTAAAHERARANSAAEAFAAALRAGGAEPAALASEHGLTAVAAFDVDARGPEPELAVIALSLPVGAWSGVIATSAGYTVLKLLRKREGEARPLSEVREQVVALLRSRRELGEQKRILGELRAEATIVHVQW
jgi:parvulin-like peptidyl-prolyl isomerase